MYKRGQEQPSKSDLMVLLALDIAPLLPDRASGAFYSSAYLQDTKYVLSSSAILARTDFAERLAANLLEEEDTR